MAAFANMAAEEERDTQDKKGSWDITTDESVV
jgi:hypothetical protein